MDGLRLRCNFIVSVVYFTLYGLGVKSQKCYDICVYTNHNTVHTTQEVKGTALALGYGTLEEKVRGPRRRRGRVGEGVRVVEHNTVQVGVTGSEPSRSGLSSR